MVKYVCYDILEIEMYMGNIFIAIETIFVLQLTLFEFEI